MCAMFTFHRKLFFRASGFIFAFDLGSREKIQTDVDCIMRRPGYFKVPENRFKSSLERRWVIPLFAFVASSNAYGSTFVSRLSVTPRVTRGSGLFFLALSSHRGRSTIIRDSISTDESVECSLSEKKKKIHTSCWYRTSR